MNFFLNTFCKNIFGALIFILLCNACNTKPTKIGDLTIAQELEQKNYKSISDAEKEIALDTILNRLNAEVNDSIIRRKQFEVAEFYYDLDNLEKFKGISKLVLKESTLNQDTFNLAKSQRYLGDYYDITSEIDSAYYYYNQSTNNYLVVKDMTNVARTKLYKAGILYDMGIYTESEVETINALKILQKTDKTRLKYECYNQLALNLKGLNNYESALEYLDEALKYLDILESEGYDKEKLIKSRITCFNNIGTVYEKLKEYDVAKEFYLKALRLENVEVKNPKLYAMIISNLAYANLLSGNSLNVRSDLYKSLDIRKKLNADAGVVNSKLTIAKYFLHQKDTAASIEMLNDTYSNATAIKSSAEILESLRILNNIDKQNNEFLSQLYFDTNDSIQNLERLTRNKFARIEFETDVVVAENKFLTTQNVNIIIASTMFVFLIGIYLYSYRVKVRNRELIYIDQQKSSNQKIYEVMLDQQKQTEAARHDERNRIARELHDGIINSVFTTKVNLQNLDIDFYKKTQIIDELEKTGTEIRQMSHDLKKNLFFKDQKLTEMLQQFIDNQKNEYTTFSLKIDNFIDWDAFSNENKIHIYRIVQESVQNVHKYAMAKNCEIFFQRKGNYHILKIKDDGIGFDKETIKQGIGLKNMMERTNFLEGTFDLQSSSKRGTDLEIIF